MTRIVRSLSVFRELFSKCMFSFSYVLFLTSFYLSYNSFSYVLFLTSFDLS